MGKISFGGKKKRGHKPVTTDHAYMKPEKKFKGPEVHMKKVHTVGLGSNAGVKTKITSLAGRLFKS
jgi:hypothetical protein